MPSERLTPEIITAAIDGFEAQKLGIDSQIAELRAMLNGRPAASMAKATSEPPKPKRRKMSAAGRRAIAAAQKARWAKLKVGSSAQATPEATKPKRKLSAAGRRAIIAATKRRWALKRAEAAEA